MAHIDVHAAVLPSAYLAGWSASPKPVTTLIR